MNQLTSFSRSIDGVLLTIHSIIDEYKKTETPQNFSTLKYNGFVTDSLVVSEKPAKDIPLIATVGKYKIWCGTIHSNDGKVDIDLGNLNNSITTTSRRIISTQNVEDVPAGSDEPSSWTVTVSAVPISYQENVNGAIYSYSGVRETKVYYVVESWTYTDQYYWDGQIIMAEEDTVTQKQDVSSAKISISQVYPIS